MDKELKCPKCNSSQTRYRVKTNDRICYVCGNIYEIEKEEDKE
jgi:ribosomal protein S27E